VNLIFLNGRMGSGKTTQGNFLQEKGFFRVIASDALAKRQDGDPDYAREVASCQSSGVLVPDNLTIQVILDYLQEHTNPTMNLVLDGCMRTPLQARTMIEYHRRAGYAITVCFLHIDDSMAMSRAYIRQRSDDSQETIKKRLQAYYDNLAPVLTTIVGLGCSIHTINGALPPDEVHREICRVAGLTPVKVPVLA